MAILDVTINLAESIAAGSLSGFAVFKFHGKEWVENWFAKDLKKDEHQLDAMKVKDEIRFNLLHKR